MSIGRSRKPLEEIESFKNLTFTKSERQIVETVLSKYSGHRLKTARRHVANLKANDVSFESLDSTIQQIFALGRDSSSLLACKLRYGEVAGERLFAEKNASCSITRSNLERKFGKEYTRAMLKRRGASLDNYVSRHGIDVGTQKWNDYLAKRADAYLRKHASGHQFARYTESYYVNLHGEELGKKVYRNRIEKQRYKVSLRRYIDEYGESLGHEICSKIKTTVARSSFISRYGEEQGSKEYEAYLDRKAKGRTYSYQSKCATNFFETLIDILLINRASCMFGCGEERVIHLSLDERNRLPQRIVSLDFVYGTKVIEYNGNNIHANPSLFDASDRPHPWNKDITAAQIWEKDAIRNAIVEARGYRVLIVWENDDVLSAIETCKKFLELP